jgi:hypothetical protein
MTDTSPERIWIETTPYDFPGYSPCWVWHSGEALEATEGLVEYVRADTIAALRAAPVAVRERAADVARYFGPSRPMARPNESNALIIGRWEGEQAASASIAATIRALPLDAPAPVDPAWDRVAQGVFHEPPASVDPVAEAARDVLAERARQVSAEGWTPEHDDQHDMGQLASAAGCYAMFTEAFPVGDPVKFWPWAADWWKPTDRRRNLVKAGALILAEIERLDRAALAQEARHD